MINQTPAKRVLGVLSLFLVAAFLFPVHNYPYRSFFNELLPVAGVMAGLIYLAALPQGRIRLPATLVVPVGLIIVIALQTFNGLLLYPIDALFPILTLLGFSVALILGATLSESGPGWPALSFALAWTFIVSCLVSLVCQHLQIFNLDASPWVTPITSYGFLRPFANLGQPNLLALLFSLSIASVWYLYLMRQLRGAPALFMIVLLLWGSALTQSRILWIIYPVFVVLFWKQPPNTRPISRMALIFLVALFAVMVFFAPLLIQYMGQNADNLLHRAGQTSVRLTLWKQAWSFSLLHPWFGAGWYQFGAEQIRYAQFFNAVEYADNAHNIVLNFADEIGWPLTVLIFSAAAYWFYVCCVRRWSSVQVRFLSLILIATMLHSMVEYPLWYGFFSVPFALVVGALHQERLGCKEGRISRPFVVLVALLTVAVTVFVCVDTVRAIQAFKSLDEDQQPTRISQPEAALPLSRPAFTLYPQYYDFFALHKLRIAPDNARENMPLFQRQALRFGFPPVLESLALLYAWDNHPDAAVMMLIKIQRLYDNGSGDYAAVYRTWEGLAKDNPGYFGAIVQRLPKPTAVPNQEMADPTR